MQLQMKIYVKFRYFPEKHKLEFPSVLRCIYGPCIRIGTQTTFTKQQITPQLPLLFPENPIGYSTVVVVRFTRSPIKFLRDIGPTYPTKVTP